MIDHRLLHGMEASNLVAVFRAEPFDGDDVPAIELMEKLNAGIDGDVAQASGVGPADEHRAGAAIAFGTNHLGAGELQLATEKIGQRGERSFATNLEAPAIDVEQQVIAHPTNSLRSPEEKE